MGFIIRNIKIEFNDYQKLNSYKADYPCVIEIIEFCKSWFDSEGRDFSFNTSGSTGPPKEIFHSKKSMNFSAELTGKYFSLVEGNMALLCLPVKFVAGRMMLVRAFFLNLDLVISTISSNPFEGVSLDLLKSLNFAAMTPMQFNYAIDNFSDSLSYIDKILLGGGPVSDALLAKIKSNNSQVFLGYGMTETLTHIAVKNLSNNDQFYECLPDIKIDIDSDNCLNVSAPHFDFIQTNDIIDLSPSNINSLNKFEWLGRRDNVINSGGIKISPEAIESVIKSYIDRPFYISFIPDDSLGEKLVIVIEGESDLNLINDLKNNLDLGIKKPRAYIFIPKFEYTETFKLNRIESSKLINNKNFTQL